MRLFRNILIIFILFASPQAVEASQSASSADVVIIVDTSTSMDDLGYDPERTSLLVSKLFSDIVPGRLAVVRLLDLIQDASSLPSKATGKKVPCMDDPKKKCNMVKEDGDWLEVAKAKRLGVIERDQMGDLGFKTTLESHLEQTANNSIFFLAFGAAEGVFSLHGSNKKRSKNIIWLSDGKVKNENRLLMQINKLKSDGVHIEAIVFGKGDTRVPKKAGLNTQTVSSPAELMSAFANAFRHIVNAPYKTNNTLNAAPTFEMKANIGEAWVVVYGDDTLGTVMLNRPDSASVVADYAADIWKGAGAYKVAHLLNPKAGVWHINAEQGGSDVAYAVVQWSSLTPVLLAPKQTVAEANVILIAAIHDSSNAIVTDASILAQTTFKANVEGRIIDLYDDGTHGDQTAADGKFSGEVSFSGLGDRPVKLFMHNELTKKQVTAMVHVGGLFSYSGTPIAIDFGSLDVDQEVCKPLIFQADHRGSVPMVLALLDSLPDGHELYLMVEQQRLSSDGSSVAINKKDKLRICLHTAADVSSSTSEKKHWLNLMLTGSSEATRRVALHLSWKVEGLSFWQKWGGYILWLLAILFFVFIVMGFILPVRFQSALALVFVSEYDELDEQSPQPLKQWKGVGIGFYRNARAFLQSDFRISGTSRGAIVALHGIKGGTQVVPCGHPLYRESSDGDWEDIEPKGRRGRAGDVFRVGQSGPFFRLATRGRG